MKRTICILFIGINSLYASAQNWEQVGLGSIWIDVLHADTVENYLYAAGDYYTATGDTIKGIAKWDGVKWDSLGSGVEGGGSIYSIERYNGKVYVSGTFTHAGEIEVNGIAVWDGIKWDSVGAGYLGPELLVYQNELYVTGGSYRIQKWNGVKWDSVGSPSTYPWWMSGVVNALGEYNGDLFLGGPLWAGYSADGIWQVGVTRFDGTDWYGLDPYGVYPYSPNSSPVNAFQEYKGELYIGGFFFKDENDPPDPPNVENNIVRWAGDSLQEVGGGVNYYITNLAVYNDELYAVGDFTMAGGVPAAYIAKWNGTEWCGLGSQFNGPVWTIEVFNGELYIGGGFTNIDGYSIKRVAKWTGGNYTDTCGVLVSAKEFSFREEVGINIDPNPTTGLITVTGLSEEPAKITVYNVLGELMYNRSFIDESIDLSYLPVGVYMLDIVQRKSIFRKKFIKVF